MTGKDTIRTMENDAPLAAEVARAFLGAAAELRLVGGDTRSARIRLAA